MIRFIDFVPVQLLRLTSPFSMQMGIVKIQLQLKSMLCLILNLQIKIVIRAGGSAAKGLGASFIRKHIIAVPVPLGYGQRGMQRHPID
ncbi:hypothetical protein D3C73_1282420 [compost metagenome]